MEEKETRVIIDRNCNLLYSSYYIWGLYKMLGKKNVHFEAIDSCPTNPDGFRFLLLKGKEVLKIAISLSDSYIINKDQYDWCDVHGSVNANFSKTPKEFHDKLVALCPSFSIRCWSILQTMYHAIANCPKDRMPIHNYWGKYKRLLMRPRYSEYLTHTRADDCYVFFLSTLWYNDEWNRNDEGVNLRRANFIRACKALDNVQFEGGLVSQGKERSSEELFSDCLSKGVSMKEWMEKTKRSALVFNTPAFWDCHGWKLGEYLAMGKCIVSTPLSNDLPAPLKHGEQVHFVENDQEAMREAVEYIMNHPDYRKRLEQGARTYWEQYGTPEASLKLLGL